MSDLINRDEALKKVDSVPFVQEHEIVGLLWKEWITALPTVAEQNFDEADLKVIAEMISIRLLSLRSAQYWRFDPKIAEKIINLEKLERKIKKMMEVNRDGT